MAPSGRGRTRRSRTIPCKKVQLDSPKKHAKASTSIDREAEALAWLNQPGKHVEASTPLDQEAWLNRPEKQVEASASIDHKAETSASVGSSDNLSKIDGVNFDNSVCCDCSTPKAKKFRIPEILTCPPAPKKRRPSASNCSLRRNPISFFAPPDLELFFFFAVRDIPV